MIDHADLLTAQGLFDNQDDEILYQRWLDEISSKDYDERITDAKCKDGIDFNLRYL